MSTAPVRHPASVPSEVTVKRVFLNCDFRCRDEGFQAHAIERLANHRNPGEKKPKGRKWANDWWSRNIDGQAGSCVLFVNRSLTLMALIGRTRDEKGRMIGFYSQARFPGKVDLGALRSAFLEAWGTKIAISQTHEQKFLKARQKGVDEADKWWELGKPW